jgi:hypothetical protein
VGRAAGRIASSRTIPVVDSQRITLIGVDRTGPGDPSGRTEACEVRIGRGGDINPDARELVIGAIQPTDYAYDDSRRHTNWGATGLEMQEIVILYAVQVLGQITAASVLAAIGKGLGELAGPRIDSTDVAWDVFQEFLLRVFKLPDAKLVSAVKEHDDWKLVAEARGRQYEGKISNGGHVIEARRIDE